MVEMVGPVLSVGPVTDAVIVTLKAMHPELEVLDRGSYLRVRAPGRCLLQREKLETVLGRAVAFPGDLERIMPSFAGRLELSGDQALWTEA